MFDEIDSCVRSTRNLSLPKWGNVQVRNNKGNGAHDVVTEIDHAIEKMLAEELAKIDPGSAFVGEEFGGDRSAERFYLCDPIDGTSHFVRGLPYCTTMLAKIERGEVVFSLIYDFVNDVMYRAEKGKGATANGVSIHVSDRSIEDAYVSWETHLDKPENLEIFQRLRSRVATFKTLSAGHEFVLVATGKIEARICFDPWGKDYDFAPGCLLVSEAGGVVGNLGERSYDYQNTNFIAANVPVFTALTEGDEAVFPLHA